MRLPTAKDLPRSESQPIGVVHRDVELERGYTSDGDAQDGQGGGSPNSNGTWLMVGKEGEVVETSGSGDPHSLVFPYEFYHHDMDAFFSAIDSMHFLIRETGQIVLDNIPSLVHCLCVFAEASMHGSNGVNQRMQAAALKRADGKGLQKPVDKRLASQKTNSTPSSPSEEENQQQLVNAKYQQRSNQVGKML